MPITAKSFRCAVAVLRGGGADDGADYDGAHERRHRALIVVVGVIPGCVEQAAFKWRGRQSSNAMIARINVVGALKISAGSHRRYMLHTVQGNVTSDNYALLYATSVMF